MVCPWPTHRRGGRGQRCRGYKNLDCVTGGILGLRVLSCLRRDIEIQDCRVCARACCSRLSILERMCVCMHPTHFQLHCCYFPRPDQNITRPLFVYFNSIYVDPSDGDVIRFACDALKYAASK